MSGFSRTFHPRPDLSMPRTVIIINPISGPKRRGTGGYRVDVATRTLERLGVQGHVRVTERGGHAHELASEAAASGADLVIGWGGDGTINEVARALVQSTTTRVPQHRAWDCSRRLRKASRVTGDSVRSGEGDRARPASETRVVDAA